MSHSTHFRLTSLILLLGTFALAQDTAGVGGLRTTVRDAQGQPVQNVRVCAIATPAEGSPRCTTTGSEGQARIADLRPGSYELEITAPQQPPLKGNKVDVRAGLDGQVEISLPKVEAVSQSVTVTESAFVAPEEIKSSGFLIQRQEISKAAGALQDVSRYVQTLPGVVIGSNDFRNDIIVRGGSPLENLFVVDNIEIPNINAFANFASAGGTVSLLDAELIEDVTFLSGGYPAPFINRTSSVLQITQREGARDRFRGRATIGFAGGGTILEGPINKGKGSWVVSARRSFLDFFTDDVGFGGVPILYTFNAKATYDLTPRDRIWAVSVSGLDSIRLGARETPQADDEEVNNLDIRYEGWRSANGFNWQRLFGDRGVGLLGITHSEAKVGSQVKDIVRNGPRPPGVPLEQVLAQSPIIFRDDSREGESTIKYDFTGYLPMLSKLQTGGAYKIFRINYNTASPFGNNTPYSPVADQNPFFLNRSFLAYQSSGYFQTTRNLTSRLNLTFGGRVDNYQALGQTRFSPRAGLSYRLTDKLSWRASYGTYYQQPFFIFLNAFPQNRGLVPFRADQMVTGFTYVASPTLRITLEGYLKTYKDYPVSSQFPSLSLANVGDTFAVRDTLFPLVSAGRGRVTGIELFAEKKFSTRWYGQANLAYMRSRQGGLDGVLRPSTYDYPVVANAVGGYRISRKWEASLRFSYLTGRPYTPFDERLSTQQRRGIFDLTQVNAQRLPDYARLDLRVDRTFTFRDKPVLLFIGAQNVTNRRNIGGIGWNRDKNISQFGEQLGLFPLIGLDWRF
jgi:outer membrane receptor protein involved in Fe transport